MNISYRLIWSEYSNSWIPVSELAKSRGKRSSGALLLTGILAAGMAPALAAPPNWPAATQLPGGAQVVAGQASMTQNGAVLTINQGTNRAAIDWNTFNIGSQATVNFRQPSAASVVLNRVLDVNPSQIFGHLNANGQVFLSNPNGVYFAPGASADVGALVATTHGIANADFMAGRDVFSRNGAVGAIVNDGTLTAALGGYIALLAPEVRNHGVIVARMGTVALAAGEAYELQFDASNTLANVRVAPATIAALVENGNAVHAPGGLVIFSAQAVDRLLGGVVNNSGAVEARGMSAAGGVIRLDAGVGRASVSGTLDVSAVAGQGGQVMVSGAQVSIGEGARIAATGATGGGAIHIGGAWQGGPGMIQARDAEVAAGATLDASATGAGTGTGTGTGNGGEITVWSDVHQAGATAVHGNLLARGGARGGAGGRIETSGQRLDLSGAVVDASAPAGAPGMWLLDPSDVTLVHGSGSTLSGGVFNPGASSAIGDTQINAALNGGTDVTILTSSGSGGSGAIVVNGGSDAGGAVAISNTSGGARGLTLSTAGTINIHPGASLAGSDGNALNLTLIAAGGSTIGGTVDNRGGSTALTGAGTLNGSIMHGTLTSSAAIVGNNGRLDGVTIGGTSLSASGTFYVSNNLGLANGVALNLNGGYWYFDGQSGGEAPGTVHHLATAGSATVNNAGASLNIFAVNGQTLQIDSGVTLRGYGALSQNWAGNIVNAGAISADVAGQTFTINPSTFSNSGTLNVNGGALSMSAGAWTNPGKINVNSGTLGLDNTFTADLLTGAAHFGRTGGYVNLNGTLDNTGTSVDVGGSGLFGAGGLSLLTGIIKSGTVLSTDANYTLTSNGGGRLDGVTLGGSSLNTGGGNLFLYHGLNLANGVTVNKGGQNWYFNGQDTGEAGDTVHHLSTNGAATLASAGGALIIYAANGQTLQIDSGVTVRGYGTLQQNWGGGTIINAGVISADTPGQTMAINPEHFVNSGTANANGGVLSISAANWSNPGKINVNSGTLGLDGTFTADLLTGAAHFGRTGGYVNLNGTLDNTGATLDVGGAGLFGAGGLSLLTGIIKSGTVLSTDANYTLTSNGGGRLDGVTLGGTSLNTGGGNLFLYHGLNLANGVTVNKGGQNWYFDGQDTGEAADTVHHLSTAGNATVNNAGGALIIYAANGQTLQIDSGVTVRGYGNLQQNWGGGTIINAGTINADTPGQTIAINPASFVNSGTANVNGGVLSISASAWTNPGKINVNSGTLSLDGSLTVDLLAGAAHFGRTGGYVNLNGTLDNTGTSVDVGGAGLFGAGGLSSLNGIILNGTVLSSDANYSLNSNGNGRLDGVTLGGTSLTMGGGNLFLYHGLNLANGVTVNKGSQNWYFDGQNTGQAADTVHHLSTGGNATVNNAGGALILYAANGQTLQVDSGVTLRGYGALQQNWGGGTIINAGTIVADTGGQAYNINTASFVNSGTLSATAGAALSVNVTDLANSGVINGNFNIGTTTFANSGTLAGSGTLTMNGGGTFTNNGILSPGVAGVDSTGTLAISGNLVMGAGSALNVDINGTLAGDYDVLSVSGTANLGAGTLNLAGISGAGSYAIVNATGGLGGSTFATINAGTFTHTPSYGASALTLAVTANSNLGIYWDGGAGSANWSDALNWSGDTLPTAGDNIYLGSGAGTVNLNSGAQSANALTCNANLTLSAGSLTLAGTSFFTGVTSISGGTLNGAGAVTIAPGASLNWSGGLIDGAPTSTLTTQVGSTANVSGGTLGLNRSWNNSGTLNVTPATWTKTGSLIQNAGDLNLNGSFATADLFAFTRNGGRVNLYGTLDNTGATLDVAGGQFGAGGLSVFGGTIAHGTVLSSDANYTLSSNGGARLDSVTLGGTSLNTGGGNLFISNDLTLADGVTVNKHDQNWYFDGQFTSQAAGTVHHLASAGNATLTSAGGNFYMYAANGQTLQIDSGVTLNGYGSLTQAWGGNTIINAGTISADTAGQTFTISPSIFTNSGTLNVNGGTLGMGAGSWTNPGKVNVNSGTLSLDNTFTVNVLTGASHFGRTGGYVNLTGTLDNTGTSVDVGGSGLFGAGGLSNFNGVILNGTVLSADTGYTLSSGGNGRLDGVTIGGTSLTTGGSNLFILHDLTLADGITVNQGNHNWYFDGQNTGEAAGTVHRVSTSGNATVNLAGGSFILYAANGQTLQIDSGVTVAGYGGLTQTWAGTIINAGAVNANTLGQTFSINPSTFTNSGTLNVNGGTLSMGAGSWTNPGKINVNSGTLSLDDTFTVDALAGSSHFARTGGYVNLNGTLDNTGTSVDVGGSGLFGAGGLTSLNGVILNGTVLSADTGYTLNSGGNARLDGVTFGGTSLTTGGSNMFFLHGLTLADGVTVNKGSHNWFFDGQNTGEAAGTVHHLATSGAATLNNAGGNIYMYAANGQTLQIDSGVTLGGYGALTQYWGGNTIINAGTINADTAGQTVTINPDFFTNSGTINVNGGTLGMSAGNWTNPGKINVNSGTLSLDDTITVDLLAGAAHFGRTGGSVLLNGTLDNTGTSVDVGGSGLFGVGGLTSLNGIIKHGTVLSADAGYTLISNGGGRLDGVTIGGSSFATGGNNLFILHDLTLADGVTVNKGGHNWFFDGQNTGEAAGTVHHLATGGNATVNNAGGSIYMYSSNGQTLQIDSGVTVGGYGNLTQYWGGNTIINAGTISADTAGQTYNVDVSNFSTSGTINVAAGATFYRGAGFTNDGTLSGGGTIAVGTGAAQLLNQGTINPGGTGATGTLTISGDLQLSTGSHLNMELGGASAGQFDRVVVSGAVSGNGGAFGAMTVSKINGYTYVNASGDDFALLSAASGSDTATFGAFTLARSNLTSTYSAANVTLDMAPMVLTVSPDALSKAYRASDPTLSYGVTGFDVTTGDTALTALSGLLGRAAGENAGAYAINQGALVSALGYAINIAPAANFTITPVAITLTSTNVSKIYDGALTALGTAAVGAGVLYSGDTLSGGTFAFTNKNVGSGNKTVSVANITVDDGNGGDNYVVSYASNTTSSITQAALTLAGTRVYDGTSTVAGSVLSATGVGGETFAVAGAGATGNLASKNAQTSSALASLSGLSLGASSNGGLSSNYTVLSTLGSSMDISKAALNVDAGVASKTYDGTLLASGAGTVGALAGVLAGETVSGAGSQAFLGKNAGTGKTVRASGVTIQDAGNVDVSGNYTISYTDNLTGSIARAALNVNAGAASKTYDGTLLASGTGTVGALAGVSAGETVSGAGSQAFLDKNAGTGKTVRASGVTVKDAGNADVSGNYTISYTDNFAGSIAKAALNVNAGAASKTYDGTLLASGAGTVGALAGVLAGETVSGAGSQVFLDKNAGTGKTVRASGVTIKDAGNADVSGNYTISYTDNLTGSIAKAALNVSANVASKTYDGSLLASGVGTVGALAGVLAGETVSGTGSQAFLDKNAGTGKTVRASGVTIKDAGNVNVSANYTISYTDNLAGSIARAALNVNAGAASKTYDGTLLASGAGTAGALAGVLAGETVSGSGSQVFLDKNAGTGKTVRASGFTIKDAGNADVSGNYTISYIDNFTGSIARAALNVNAGAASKTYDGTLLASGAGTVGTLAGALAGETVSGVGSQVFLDKNAGTGKTVRASGVTIKDAGNADVSGNYTISYTDNFAGSIARAALNVNASAASKTYDGTLFASGAGTVGALAGVLAGETVSGAGSQAFLDKNAGTGKTVRASGVTIKDAGNVDVSGNYTISYTDNFAGSIAKAALNVNAGAASKTYDGTLLASGAGTAGALAGVLAGETVSGSGSQVFLDKNAGTGKTVRASGVTIKDAGNLDVSGNYTISYIDNFAGSIARAALNVDAGAASKTYDGTLLASGAGTVGALAGALAGETVSGAGSQVFLDKNAGTGKAVRASGVTIKDAGNVDVSGNYTISYTDNFAGS
ncbi:filamentous hemagglutinin family protein, partial [Oxalobacteraceae bacterium GrIS 1.11]